MASSGSIGGADVVSLAAKELRERLEDDAVFIEDQRCGAYADWVEAMSMAVSITVQAVATTCVSLHASAICRCR